MIEHEHEEHKHVLTDEGMTPYQRFVHKVLWRLLELSTLEVLIALAHFALTFMVVFYGIGHGGAA